MKFSLCPSESEDTSEKSLMQLLQSDMQIFSQSMQMCVQRVAGAAC
jgi:hypothetical protein